MRVIQKVSHLRGGRPRGPGSHRLQVTARRVGRLGAAPGRQGELAQQHEAAVLVTDVERRHHVGEACSERLMRRMNACCDALA